MKSLILIFFVATSVQAQSVADAARQERARQRAIQEYPCFSDANTHTVKPITPAEPSLVPVPGSKDLSTSKDLPPKNLATAATGAALNAAAAAAPVDPGCEEMQKLRIRVRALEIRKHL
jgi:hypothetical protein